MVLPLFVGLVILEQIEQLPVVGGQRRRSAAIQDNRLQIAVMHRHDVRLSGRQPFVVCAESVNDHRLRHAVLLDAGNRYTGLEGVSAVAGVGLMALLPFEALKRSLMDRSVLVLSD